MERFVKLFISFFVIFLIISLLLPTDPTDKSRWTRSNMNWYKDYGTGCEYLAGGGLFGSKELIPRLNKDGNHVCK